MLAGYVVPAIVPARVENVVFADAPNLEFAVAMRRVRVDDLERLHVRLSYPMQITLHCLLTFCKGGGNKWVMKKDTGTVYIFQMGTGGPVKIGHATDIHKRYDQVQIGCVEPLIIRAAVKGGRELEKLLHKEFSTYRLRGEWFQPVDDLFARLADLPPADNFTPGRPRQSRDLRMPAAAAEKIWRNPSIPFREALKLMTGWSWKAAKTAFGYRSGSNDPRYRNGQDREAARRYGKIGGQLTKARVKREMAGKRMPKTEAGNIWRNPLLTNGEALAQMTGWTQASAYRILKTRKLAKGRPRNSDKAET